MCARPIGSLPAPSLVAWPRDEAAHAGVPWEIWWVTAILRAPDRRLSAHLMVTHSGAGSVVTTAAISDLDTEAALRTRITAERDQVTLAEDHLEARTELGAFRGSFDDGYRLDGRLDDDAGFALELRPTTPVLHNGGAGRFTLGGIATTQYSIGGLEASGTLRWHGQQMQVSGHAWYDRQWIESGRLADTGGPFTWFGICLDNGETISLWDTSMRPAGGRTWATIARPDGTHLVTSAAASPSGETCTTPLGRDVPRQWAISIPGMQGELDVRQRLVQDAPGAFFYTGALEVRGRYQGGPVSGYGFCDLVAWEA